MNTPRHKFGRAAAAIIAFSYAASAHAQLEPVNNIATTVLNFMTGTFATIAGAIAIAYVGYRWFTGRMDLGRALTIGGGIVLVLGATQIVTFIQGGIGGG